MAQTTFDGSPVGVLEALRQLRRQAASYQGIWSWIATVDHKRIGIMYGITAFLFFLAGGVEALAIRLQLARPGAQVLDQEVYNQMFTMHGTTMIFLVVMPLSAAFFNLIVPLQIGARDVAFPRLNAFSYWTFLMGGIFLYSSIFFGGAPNGGWFGYAPLTEKAFNPGHGIDFWALGLQILGISSLASGFNFIVTILNMRAPGMSLLRMPVFTWMTLVTSFLIIFAMPVLAVGLFELSFDRLFGANFFNPLKGGTPLLWQHLFWLFGHPEVYILILPAMGIVSEVLPTFARKPLFGYPFVVFSGIAIAFMSFGVWVHHMYTTGLGPVANSAFGVSTILIAVPTGVKIFNWLGTLWGGDIRFKTPLLFALGFITMFVVGGLTGVTHSMVPSDYQQQDTYYVVAHFHQVLFGGAIFALFAGIYYWFPKFTGKLLDERLGQLHFWLMLIGFNVTFQPMMILGLLGMPRRIQTYPTGMGWDLWNMIATVGAFLIALSVLVFIINVIITARRGQRAGADPWDGRTLEWSIPSPVPPYNFARIPLVRARDDFWHQKYREDEAGRPIPVVAGGAHQEHEEEHAQHIHMPSPSFFPLIAAMGFPIIAYGFVLADYALVAAGAVVLLFGIYGWALEPASE
ncbi:MAG TPA: cytochrome c oxidase subunit I [Dehalococcoidia bacterium]|nr:cytochrome c oxidase subunit I [Dehalococcoidia bacterium]